MHRAQVVRASAPCRLADVGQLEHGLLPVPGWWFCWLPGMSAGGNRASGTGERMTTPQNHGGMRRALWGVKRGLALGATAARGVALGGAARDQLVELGLGGLRAQHT